MNLPGIATGHNVALVIKMVHQSTTKVEAFCHLFIMVALVLRFFGAREVHWGTVIITTVATSGVTQNTGSGWSYLGGGWVGLIGAARKGSMGSDLVVKFYSQFYKFVEILGLNGLVYETGLELLG
jgi:hypothetical protein